jgi:acetyl-CoA acetyltransferase
MHPFGKFSDRTAMQMCQQVATRALQDAGLEWRQVQAVAAGSSRFSGGLARGLAGNDVAAAMGLTGIPVYNLSAACATGGNAFNVGYSLIASGLYDVVLVIAGEKMPKGFIARPAGAAEDASDIDFVRWAYVGIPNPGYWALECRRRMEDYGTTEKHLALVTVKARGIGEHNPNARYRQAITIEEVLASPMVSSPLRLYEICAVSDGAAAAILCSDEFARRLSTTPLWIAASTVATAQFGDPAIRIPEVSTTAKPSGPYVSEATGAVMKAFEMSGMTPSDVDFIELTDNSVWQELAYPEIWGFCEPGQADWLLERGETGVEGMMPINPSGGFLSFGEATNAMGVFQLCEMAWQLRRQAGKRQVPDAKVGLAQTLGLGGNGSAIILKR